MKREIQRGRAEKGGCNILPRADFCPGGAVRRRRPCALHLLPRALRAGPGDPRRFGPLRVDRGDDYRRRRRSGVDGWMGFGFGFHVLIPGAKSIRDKKKIVIR